MKNVNKKGFTLIELIVVIAILGVLAGIATPSIFAYIAASQQRADQATAKQIQSAVSLMFSLDTSNAYIDNMTGGVKWTEGNKVAIRRYIGEKLGTVTNKDAEAKDLRIPRPKENAHYFYMYLLPPYTTISLATADSTTAAINTAVVTEAYLSARYPTKNYAQVNAKAVLDLLTPADKDIGPTEEGSVTAEDTSTIGWLNILDD